MTTMLDRAANEVAMIPMWRGSDGLNVTVSHELATHIARAVLMAVREPDGDVVSAGERAAWDSSNSMPAIRAMPRGFTAMIDAILSETP